MHAPRFLRPRRLLVLSLAFHLPGPAAFGETSSTPTLPVIGQPLSSSQVEAFARLALDGIFREFPNKPSNVISGPDRVLSPKAMHPAFYGCFDWHSSVHGHWMLVRLLRLHPEHPLAPEITEALDRQLTAEHLRAEAAYFERDENRSFERMYGWAWALRLVAELRTWDDPRARRWAGHLVPLEKTLVGLTEAYLPRLTWPIRTGVHPDTGFALGQVLDYARAVGNESLETLVRERSLHFYQEDEAYPAAYEPSGEDFFSPGLNEADLMRRVLDPRAFSAWLGRFLPGLAEGKAGNLLEPVVVSDVTDGKLVHLAGLNLSRAWTLHAIASGLPAQDARRAILQKAAGDHLGAGLGYVFSGHYEGEHWLATFAVYALSEVGIPD